MNPAWRGGGDEPDGFLADFAPATRIALFLAIAIVAVTTPAGRPLSFAGYAAFLLILLLTSRVSARMLFLRALAALPFIAVLLCLVPFIPEESFRAGHPSGAASRMELLATLFARSMLSILSVILLTLTTPFPLLLEGLRTLRLPSILLMILAFAWRFIFVIREEAIRMKRAAVSRLYRARSLRDAALIGRIIANLFLRSYERSERIYLAMVSRGFSGTLPASRVRSIRAADGALFLLSLVILLAMRFSAR